MPADQLGLGRAFTDVRQFEDIVAGCRRLDSGGCRRLNLRRFGDHGRGVRFGDGRGGRRRGVIGITRPLDLELHQRTAHRHHGAGFAVQGDDLAADRGGDLDRGLVGHDVGDDLVLGDGVADLDVPSDQFGLGGAFAHVGQFEDETTHLIDLPS